MLMRVPSLVSDLNLFVFCCVKEDVLAPPPENDDVVNDFDIEEEVIEVENRLDFLDYIVYVLFHFD